MANRKLSATCVSFVLFLWQTLVTGGHLQALEWLRFSNP